MAAVTEAAEVASTVAEVASAAVEVAADSTAVVEDSAQAEAFTVEVQAARIEVEQADSTRAAHIAAELLGHTAAVQTATGAAPTDLLTSDVAQLPA
jgi:hypothetical protein